MAKSVLDKMSSAVNMKLKKVGNKLLTPAKTDEFSITINVKLQRLADMLCSALEGGSNYWCQIESYKEPKTLVFRTDKSSVYKHIDYPMNDGGAVVIKDLESTDGKTYIIDLPTIRRGAAIMAQKYPRKFADMLTDNDDAWTADCFLQCCAFGDEIYG